MKLKTLFVSAAIVIMIVLGVGLSSGITDAKLNQTPFSCTAVDIGTQIKVTVDANPLFKNYHQAPSAVTLYVLPDGAPHGAWDSTPTNRDFTYVGFVGDTRLYPDGTFLENRFHTIRAVVWTRKGWADTFCTITGDGR